MSRLLLAAVIAAMTGAAAQAHITFEKGEAPVGGAYKAVLRVPHGCAGEATLKVRVRIPEGVIEVKPMPKPGWKLDTVTGAYAQAYDYFGSKVSEGVTEIVWTGDLADGHNDEFVFHGTITEGLEVGSELFFPMVQECASKTERWIEIPAAGRKADDYRFPAPGLRLAPAKATH